MCKLMTLAPALVRRRDSPFTFPPGGASLGEHDRPLVAEPRSNFFESPLNLIFSISRRGLAKSCISQLR